MSRQKLVPIYTIVFEYDLIWTYTAAPAMAGRISGVMATTGYLYNAASLSAGTPR